MPELVLVRLATYHLACHAHASINHALLLHLQLLLCSSSRTHNPLKLMSSWCVLVLTHVVGGGTVGVIDHWQSALVVFIGISNLTPLTVAHHLRLLLMLLLLNVILRPSAPVKDRDIAGVVSRQDLGGWVGGLEGRSCELLSQLLDCLLLWINKSVAPDWRIQ